MTTKSLQMGFIDQYLLNNKNNKKQKEKKRAFGVLIPKLATSTSNGKYQLFTCMLQAPSVLGGLMLILIFATHFLQAQFNQVQLPCGLNSCTILYYIFLSMAQAHVTYLGKLRKCDFKGMGQFLSNLLHEPSKCVLASEQGTLVAHQVHKRGLVPKIFTQNSLYVLADYGLKFLPKPFFP